MRGSKKLVIVCVALHLKLLFSRFFFSTLIEHLVLTFISRVATLYLSSTTLSSFLSSSLSSPSRFLTFLDFLPSQIPPLILILSHFAALSLLLFLTTFTPFAHDLNT